MPIYEYTCLNCNADFEKLVFSFSPKVSCPKCKGENLMKKMSLFSSQSGDVQSVSPGRSGCSSCTSHNCGSCGV